MMRRIQLAAIRDVMVSSFALILASGIALSETAQAPDPLLDLRERAAWDPAAQIEMGLAYEHGILVPRNVAEAARWYRAAAERGNVEAQVTLGDLYILGRGVARDASEAAMWWRKAAAQGDAGARYSLGMALWAGNGVRQDVTEATKWLRLAAEQGHASAQLWVGRELWAGDGMPKDPVEGVAWLRRAAEQGNAEAQTLLGAAYAVGVGVPRDRVESLVWQRRAAGQGFAPAMEMLALAYQHGAGVIESPAAAIDWWYQAGVAWQKEAKRENALRCVERIRELKAPNSALGDRLLESIYVPASGATDQREAAPGVGRSRTSSGTAWVVAPNYLLTNQHVVEGRTRITVRFPSGITARADISARDAANDMALLHIENVGPIAPPLPVARMDPPPGTDVFTISYPHLDIMGVEPKVTSGIVSAASGPGNDIRLFQMTAPVQAGSSGGPILNMRGEVVGFVIAKLDPALTLRATGDLPENVAYGIKVSYVRAFVSTRSVPMLSTRAAATRSDLVRLAHEASNSVAAVLAE